MEIFRFIMAAAVAYLIGSIPFGYLISLTQGVDIRTVGSGNIGATNVFRTLGKKFGIITFMLDVLKGALAVSLVPCLVWAASGGAGDSAWCQGAALACAVTVLLGHGFPVFLHFKGGKGVATGLGLAIGLVPWSALVGLLLWIVVFVVSRYVSVASCAAAAMVAVSPWFLDRAEGTLGTVVCVLISVLALAVIAKHHSNIKRLMNGTENRFCFTKRQREAQQAKK